jgi:hypothetical protein
MSTNTTTRRPWTAQSRSYSMGNNNRQWTAQSRPTTARPQTAASVRHEGSYVVALLEGRGVSREVGIAALDKDTGKVMLVQVFMNQRIYAPFLFMFWARLLTARPTSNHYTRCTFTARVLCSFLILFCLLRKRG